MGTFGYIIDFKKNKSSGQPLIDIIPHIICKHKDILRQLRLIPTLTIMLLPLFIGVKMLFFLFLKNLLNLLTHIYLTLFCLQIIIIKMSFSKLVFQFDEIDQ